MKWPNPSDFREARRGLPVIAAVLFAAAVLFPMWEISVSAVQYPDTILNVKLYAYPHISGDYGELASLNKYIGFYYPDPVFVEPNWAVHERAVDVPEWSIGTVGFVGVASTGAFVAIAPTVEKLKRGLKWQFLGTVAVFGIMLADIQYRLWQAGHTLDPDAPVMGIGGFTPPIWGKYAVANITSVSRLSTGGYMSVVAVGLLIVAYYYRDSQVTIDEVPGRIVGRIRTVPDTVRAWRGYQ
ncbi:MAG: hypothetical protein ACI8XM_000649 [Haloarculaceae archaeon]|jgi:hypothetical protein